MAFNSLGKISVAVALTMAATAGAQVAPSNSGISSAAPLSNVKAYRDLQTFGSCLARLQRPAALALIATAPGSSEEGQVLRRLSGERATCFFPGTRMKIPAVYARGAIAEGLLRQGGVPDTHRLTSVTAAEVRDLHGVARCYTSGHRAEVEKLLGTQVGSPEEVKAVAALWNDFRACMPRFNVRLNAPWIRFLLAEALLRLPQATTTASAG